jgi:hypothetical protein
MTAADADEEDLADRLLDLLVYAPLGLALEAKDLLPKLAERGRGQIALTRLAGTVAARQGQQEAEKLVDDIRESITTFLGMDTPDAEPTADAGDTVLPIRGYATMTAVEIIPLLGDLDAAQLDAVEAFERSNRNRVTILNRIAQRRTG